MKRALIVLFLLTVASPLCFSLGNRELKRSDSKILTDNIIKWKNHEIRDYSMKIEYSYSNNIGQIYEITVIDGELAGTTDNRDFLEGFTVDGLFEDARKYVKANKKDSPMLYMFKYDEEYGYINYLARIYNPNVKAGVAPSGYNFVLKVLEFSVLERDSGE